MRFKPIRCCRRSWSAGVLSLSLLSGATTALALDRIPGVCNPARFVVAVDVGHSRKSSGATSARGLPEFKFNQTLAKALQQALQADGFSKAFLINADGRIGSLSARVRAAERARADLFISIHHDSVQPKYLRRWTVDGKTRRYSDEFQGYSLFVSAKNSRFEDSQRVALLVGVALRARGQTPTLHHAEPIKGENRPLLDRRLGVYRFDDLIVLKRNKMPALLVEAGVIVHRDEETAMADPARQQLLAAAIVAGVRGYCAGMAPPDPQRRALRELDL